MLMSGYLWQPFAGLIKARGALKEESDQSSR